ncbi:MAG: AsmA-like C-terminal region-containing protein [Acidocella sp.]|nr:AsmA-like C-terminal region-containing protein [Acidocella sp.]
MTRKKALWIALPVGILLLAASLILALPSLVSSPQNRTTIEELASSLTGRNVHISGNLSLALKPAPQLIAGDVTITGPDAEIITAKSLTLDIALGALLHGELSASSLMLQSPTINFPWPLPNGAAAIAPPPWLAALHAQINDGQISFGSLMFTHVSADIFTGAQGSLSVSGSGLLQGQHIELSLSLGALDTTGTAPVTIDVKTANTQMHLSGIFSTENSLTGKISLTTTGTGWLSKASTLPVTASGTIHADPVGFRISNLVATQASAQLTGDAAFDFKKPQLDLHLAGDQLDIQPTLSASELATLHALNVHIDLNFNNSTVAGVTLTNIQTSADIAQSGVSITALNVTLPGNGVLSFTGAIDPSGNLRGKTALTADDFAGALSAFGIKAPLPAGWQTSLAANLSGPLNQLDISAVTGTLGPATLSGTARLQSTPGHLAINGAWHLSELDLTPLVAALSQFKPASNMSADIELTADRANFHKILMTNFLIDAGFSDQLVVRRLTASLYNGVAAASFTVAAGGQISSARALLTMPSALPLAALLPAALSPPVAITNTPLAALIEASGPADALATSGTLTLGPFSITASPVLDFVHLAAKGPLTMRHPSAIAAFKAFGLPANLAWPGAGSISLRANMAISQTQIGLTDFVLSMGDLTAAGKFAMTPDDKITAQIDADTLALPPMSSDLSSLWAGIATASGKIDVSANRVLYAGNQIFGASAGSIAMQPNDDVLTVAHASFGNGTISGSISTTTAPATPPSLGVSVTVKAVDLTAVHLPVAFPLTLPSGLADGQINLTASGFSPATWVATLNGTGTIQIKAGGLTGFNLGGLSYALTLPSRATSLRNACTTGATAFDNLTMDATVDHGIVKIGSASLQSGIGKASATGTIDLPDQETALNIHLLANVASPPDIGLAIVGPWGSAHKVPDIRAGLRWQPIP